MFTRRLYTQPNRNEKDQQPSQAVALGYDPEHDTAPRVLASGWGETASKIIEIAQEHGIPIHEDPILAASLAQIDLDTTIPPELYLVVAEILAYVYRVQKRKLELPA